MSALSTAAWIGLLAAIAQIAFVLWYGGRTRPLTAEERSAFFRLMHQHRLDRDDPELLAALQQLLAADDGREFVMVNLIRYRAKAAYPEGYAYDDSAAAADRRYARAFFPWLLRYGNFPLFIARRSGTFIEPVGAEPWQMVAMIRYRSRRDFVRSVTAVAGRGVMVHKWAAIETTHVFPVQPMFSFVAVRLVAALVVAITAAGSWLFFG